MSNVMGKNLSNVEDGLPLNRGDRWNTIGELEEVLELKNDLMKKGIEGLVKYDVQEYLKIARSYNKKQYNEASEYFAKVICIYRFFFQKKTLRMDSENYIDGYVCALEEWCNEVIIPNKDVIDRKYLDVACKGCGYLEVLCSFYKENSLIRENRLKKIEFYNRCLNIIWDIIDKLK